MSTRSSNPRQGMSRYANENVPRSKLKVRRSSIRSAPFVTTSREIALDARW